MNLCKIAFLGIILQGTLLAEIVLKEPVDQNKLALLPQNQKEILAMPSHSERLKILSEDKAKGKNARYFHKHLIWGRPADIRFRWECTAGEKAPFIIQIADNPDFKNCKLLYSRKDYIHPGWFRLNFKLGQKYYWKVMTQNQKSVSKTFSFVTEDQAPRWIQIEGKVGNMRDLGGWKAADGKTVKQGMLFRGQGLNDNSADRKIPGRNRLMVEDLNLLCNELGIRTDLDLRSTGETANMKVSPLGEKVKFINISAPAYIGIHSAGGMKTMAKEFKVLADPENYPIYFHCIGGWDRTGALAFVANGLLGVPENQLALDWELTTLPNLPDMPPKPDPERNYAGMVKGFDKYGNPDDPLSLKIENYLLKNGVTPSEIAAFKKLMLEQ